MIPKVIHYCWFGQSEKPVYVRDYENEKFEDILIPGIFNNFAWNEDLFWGRVVTNRFDWFKVPGMMEAGKFSFERNCQELYRLNYNQMPFGCHRWEQFDTKFWKPFIKIESR